MRIEPEPFDCLVADAGPIFVRHHRELALNQDVIKMDLDLERFRELERKDALFVLVARDAGKVIGYLLAFLLPHMHYKSAGLMALVDMYYILPEHRRGAGARLFLEFERLMRVRGIVQMMCGCKVHQDHGALFEKLGWTWSDKTFIKVLGCPS